MEDDLTRFCDEYLSRWSEFRSLMVVFKDAESAGLFQAENLLAERRLTHVQPVCRS